MATISFLWHLHQPCYRTADGVSHAPWALLHAGGAYTTLARAISDAGGRGHTLNIVPTLLEQLRAYADGTVSDPIAESLLTPVADLSDHQRATLIEWCAHVNPRQLERYPRLAELIRRRPVSPDGVRASQRFGFGDLRDLQILFVLAHAGEQAWSDQRLRPLFDRGADFSKGDHERMSSWLDSQPAELIALWDAAAEADDVAISTSPYAHPIMPLLIDTSIVEASWAPHPAPVVPPFRHPDDARWQLEEGLRFMRDHGFRVSGCWPPEGSVSSEAVALYHEADLRWLVTDEGILERSLERPLRNGGHGDSRLYRAWRLQNGGPALFFRDRRLSDAVGFQYGRWESESQAAEHLVRELEELARTLPDDACVTIALDGENPWLYYPEGGGRFLREMCSRLNHTSNRLVPATLDHVAASVTPDSLDRLHPGSWINSVFATWIGHPEKTRAWKVLADVRGALAERDSAMPPSLMLAEGSDWFWWLGDDNPTALAPLYDRIFRRHLADACHQAGIDPPVDLDIPLKTATLSVQVPVHAHRTPPRLDGKVTDYFEWSAGTWVEGPREGPLTRLALRAGAGTLHILIEGRGALQSVIDGQRLTVRLTEADGRELEVEIGDDGVSPAGTACAVGRVVEMSLPWSEKRGSRLDVRLGEWHLPERTALLLEPFAADYEYTDRRRKE